MKSTDFDTKTEGSIILILFTNSNGLITDILKSLMSANSLENEIKKIP